MKILIVDDEKPARDLLKAYLSGIDGVEITGEAANGFEAMKAIADLKPELILLDVQMPKLNGFEMLELLDDPPAVIFTTAYDEYALKAFEINAVDYLMKPFDKLRLQQALDKYRERSLSRDAINRLKSYNDDQKETLDKVVVKKGRKVCLLKPDDIQHICAEDDYVMINTGKERYLKGKTMAYFEQHLPDNFIRIHRSHIINMDFIAEIEPYTKETLSVTMKNGDAIKASKSGTAALRKLLRQ
ncbi:MAG: LytR/AlgR family response regulator transcription factor [Bacteroidota bacterium]